MAERRYQAIVFDWDGTLIDSARTIVECMQQASRDLGIDVPSDAQASHVIGLGLHDALRLAVPALPVARYMEFAAAYRAYFTAREDRMALFSGVPELLDTLRSQGYRLAVATGKTRRGLDRAFDASGLRKAFVASRCADETRPKPDPTMLIELMDELGVSGRTTLMVGDTSHDLEMARSARVDAVAVTYGAHAHAALQALAPRACVSSIEELRKWIAAHG